MNVSASKQRYEYYKSKNICAKCGFNDAAPGRVKCWDCLYKENENSIKYQKTKMTEEQKERKRVYNRNKKNLCVAFKVCIGCMKKDATHGQKCLECYVKEKNRNKLKRMN